MDRPTHMSPLATHPAPVPPAFATWLYPDCNGLFCAPGNFYIDPHRAVARAVVTHGHADHARPGHTHVLATAETIAVMQARYGNGAGDNLQRLPLGERIEHNGVGLWLAPAGHVLGSAQVVLEWQGRRAVISGDYKRRADPTTPWRCHKSRDRRGCRPHTRR